MRFVNGPQALAAASILLSSAATAQPAPAQPAPAQPAPTPPPVAQPATIPPQPFPAPAGAIRGRIQVCPAARGDHHVLLQAGQRYAITATAPGFDPYLRLLQPGTEAVLAEDDDSGGGVMPRLVFAPAQTGEYVVRVTGVAAESTGDYALSVTPLPPLPGIVARPSRIERGQRQVFDGALGPQSPSEFGRRFHDYALQLSAGESAMIHVQGQNVDTALQIFPIAARAGRPIAEDDDGGGGRDPFIFFAPAQSGTYVVRVIGATDAALGPYRLRISR